MLRPLLATTAAGFINGTPAGIDGRWLTGISGWLTETAGRLAGKMGARSVAAGGASV